MDQSFKKLNHKILAFFEVIRNKKGSVKLQLAQLIKIPYVFHLDLLQKVLTNFLINQVNEPLPLVIINNKEE